MGARRRTRTILIASLVLAVTRSGWTVTDDAPAEHQDGSPVERSTLANGLDVILRPVDGAITTAVVTLFDLGELHDPPGQSGLAHLVEHVYVTAATDTAPARTADAWFARYSGQANAQTGRNYTLFATVFESDRLAEELGEAASRMGALRIEETDLAREKPRLELELRNMYEAMPALAALNRARAAAVPLAPGARKGGAPEQVRAIDLDAVRRFYARHYKPVNATIVVVGRFDPAAIRALIDERFGPIDAGERPEPGPAPADPDTGRIERVEAPGAGLRPPGSGIVTIGYAAPAPDDAGFAAFLHIVAALYQAGLPAFGAGGAGVMPVTYAPLDDPSLVALSGVITEAQSDEDAVAALHRRVVDAAALPAGAPPNPMPVRTMFGPFLGLLDLPEPMIAANPYLTALSLGRLHQMRIDPTALTARLDAVTTDDVRRCAETLLAPARGAVVIIRP